MPATNDCEFRQITAAEAKKPCRKQAKKIAEAATADFMEEDNATQDTGSQDSESSTSSCGDGDG